MTVVSPIANPWAGGTSASITEPGTSKKDLGWIGAEKPPHEYLNWILNNADDKINEIISTYANPTEATTFESTVTFENFLQLTEHDAYLLGADNDTESYVLLFTSTNAAGVGKTRVYYKAGTKFSITHNAEWDDSLTVWQADDTSSPAHLFEYSNVRVSKYYKATTTVAWSGWSSTDELSPLISANQLQAYRQMNGAYYYKTGGCLAAQFQILTDSAPGAASFQDRVHVPWGRRLTGVVLGDITLNVLNQNNWTATPTISNVTDWGCLVTGTSNSIAEGIAAYCEFELVVST